MVRWLLLAFVLISYTTVAVAHDTEHSELDQWYRELKMPDNPLVPCCGLADAYWADAVHVRDGKTYATITDNRADAPLRRRHVPMGTEIEIPNVKLKWDAGNPTGHAVVFLNVNNVALCYVQSGGY